MRFKENKIVNFLTKQFGLNELAAMDFPQEDWEQLAQLIGYSLSGFGDLSYVRDETFATADAMRAAQETGITPEQARINYLQDTLKKVRESMRVIVPELFRIHPDDLHE